MNRITITTSAAVLLSAASSIALAGSAVACQTTVDPFTGTLVCADTSQPSGAAYDASSPWLGIAVGVALVVAAVLLLIRRPARRAPAVAQPQAPVSYRTRFTAAAHTDTQTRLAELEAELQDERDENERLRIELQTLRTV